jgi:hypothetical protein
MPVKSLCDHHNIIILNNHDIIIILGGGMPAFITTILLWFIDFLDIGATTFIQNSI